jgi:peptide/nickel transport system permease protein
MSNQRTFWFAAGALGVMHGAVLFAGFLAPYHFGTQSRTLAFAPPARVHFFNSKESFHVRPFVYQWKAVGDRFATYEEDQTRIYPVQFFAPGDEYQVFGLWRLRRHLFGVESPARIFLLGSDGFGRDQLSRLLYGGQISLLAGLLAAVLSVVLGTVVGTISGFFGHRVDEGLMRVSELFLALPWLYLLFAVRAFMPLRVSPSGTFLLLVAIIGLVGWARPARLVRGIVLSAKERNYVLAARGFGASDLYLMRRHILPQAYGVALTQAALLIPQYVLAEVTLSFLGLGVGEPVPSWGNMLTDLQRYQVLVSYWWMMAPAIVLVPVSLVYYSLSNALHARVKSGLL